MGIEKIFSKDTVHKSTNHSKGEFVEEGDKSNTINDLENQNKHLKLDLKRRRPRGSLWQFMAVYFYRRTKLRDLRTDGERVFVFLNDIKLIYPGPHKEGLKLEKIHSTCC